VRVPSGVWKTVKEILRHLLRRPVVGICAVARTRDGRFVLIRRADTGKWALPGGTLEWGETFRASIERELWEEAGVRVEALGELLGVFSDPSRDPRFHAVTALVEATVSEPAAEPDNPLEILEVGLFEEQRLPPAEACSHGTSDFLRAARGGRPCWE
jgi:8-oxo-dGTP diphosphatase